VVGGSAGAPRLGDDRSASTPLQQLIKATEDAAQNCHAKKSNVQKKLELILSTLNRYATGVDVLIQQHPDTTALVWGVIRMLITVSIVPYICLWNSSACFGRIVTKCFLPML